MLWTFYRDDDHLHYEIRRALDGAGFELVVYHPDGRQECERFADSAALNRRALEVQHTLLDGGWFVAADQAHR
jgi:hypothetical protein